MKTSMNRGIPMNTPKELSTLQVRVLTEMAKDKSKYEHDVQVICGKQGHQWGTPTVRKDVERVLVYEAPPIDEWDIDSYDRRGDEYETDTTYTTIKVCKCCSYRSEIKSSTEEIERYELKVLQDKYGKG